MLSCLCDDACKKSLVLIENSPHSGNSRFLLMWSFTICQMLYNPVHSCSPEETKYIQDLSCPILEKYFLLKICILSHYIVFFLNLLCFDMFKIFLLLCEMVQRAIIHLLSHENWVFLNSNCYLHKWTQSFYEICIDSNGLELNLSSAFA